MFPGVTGSRTVRPGTSDTAASSHLAEASAPRRAAAHHPQPPRALNPGCCKAALPVRWWSGGCRPTPPVDSHRPSQPRRGRPEDQGEDDLDTEDDLGRRGRTRFGDRAVRRHGEGEKHRRPVLRPQDCGTPHRRCDPPPAPEAGQARPAAAASRRGWGTPQWRPRTSISTTSKPRPTRPDWPICTGRGHMGSTQKPNEPESHGGES